MLGIINSYRRRKLLWTAILSLCLLMCTHSFVFAEQSAAAQSLSQTAPGPSVTDQTAAGAQARLSLAVSSSDYPVTPGDVYDLTYYQPPNERVSVDVLVNGNWEINLGVFGKISGRGLTFVELKRKVEKLISDSYSHSLPSLRIKTPGLFRVEVTGEVNELQFITAWGLTKLSTVFERAKDAYSSRRRVEVRFENGRIERYDLLKAMREGASRQDPYVKPGETIVLVPRGRTVTLSGDVRHPGKYELLQGEGLRDLVEVFGGGATSGANLNRILIKRNLADRPSAVYVSIPQAYTSHFGLSNGDSVVVTSRAGKRSVVWLEGAVTPPPSTSGTTAQQASKSIAGSLSGGSATATQHPNFIRFSLPIQEGEMLSDALQEATPHIFLPTADLSNASLVRGRSNSTVRINLNEVMADPGGPADVQLRPNDTIYVPSLPSTVSVFGAVMTPGFFAWEAGQPASYYIGLAGGIDPIRNGNGKYLVTDANGRRRSPKDPIGPGDRIYVPLNAFGYRLSRTTPTVLAIVATILNAATFVYLTTR